MTEPAAAPLLLTLPILERMRSIEGWLSDHEADLLIAGLARALADLPAPHSVVEVGSYQGRSTSVLGGVMRDLEADGTLFAIDPHDGEVGALDQGTVRTRPTLDAFTRNLGAAGLSDLVTTVQKRSYEVEWDRPISFLLVDGLHDYANVSRDFLHFEPWLQEGAYAAFHDYADYYPGVRSFVDELLASGRYALVRRSETMVLIRRRAEGEESARATISVRSPADAESAPRMATVAARPGPPRPPSRARSSPA